jgi:hypothetical protein
MINRRILISVAAACALSAGVAGGAAAMPDSIDGPVPETSRPDQRTTTPAPPSVSADEINLFQQRAQRIGIEQERDVPSPGEKALDREYELAGYVRVPPGTAAPAWFDALFARSDALNRMYGLGAYASLAH